MQLLKIFEWKWMSNGKNEEKRDNTGRAVCHVFGFGGSDRDGVVCSAQRTDDVELLAVLPNSTRAVRGIRNGLKSDQMRYQQSS